MKLGPYIPQRRSLSYQPTPIPKEAAKYVSEQPVIIRFYLGRWSNGYIKNGELHIDGYSFTAGMVRSEGWDVIDAKTKAPCRGELELNSNLKWVLRYP